MFIIISNKNIYIHKYRSKYEIISIKIRSLIDTEKMEIL